MDQIDNKIELKTVSELFGMNFFIPNYQRGYRWTEQQVKDLLNDINEFKDENGGFYCLQPLVVKHRETTIKDEDKNIDDVEKNPKRSWEVIDGQQRLTTIFILMKCLEISDTYSLEYETRTESKKFLDDIYNDTNEDNSDKNPQNGNNIDFYHMSQAKGTIDDWFKNKDNKQSFKDKLLKKVKFIWYESVDEDPIKVFTRLNIGKIALTNSELIKAIFLNRSNFNLNENEHTKLRQQEIASEWDKIEYSLQNDEFWLFLHNKGYDRPTRIDFIFDLICDANEKDSCKEKIGTDDYKTFRYFYEYFKSDATPQKTKIIQCWAIIKKCFQTFEEWYNDLELFHYIGFLIDCKGSGQIITLLSEWNKQTDKQSFIKYLKTEVKNVIDSCPDLYKLCENKTKCKPILLFHNIQTVINQNKSQQNNKKYKMGTFYKFPFHLYKLENWDVEHINSNTTNPESDTKSQEEWLLNIYLGVDELQEMIKEYFNLEKDEKNAKFKEIKKEFIEKNGSLEEKNWTQEDKNMIWNYTLLDSSTNRSYGNSIFSAKRRIIIGKDKGKLIPIPKLTKNGKFVKTEEPDSSSSFVPPCTKHVFLKYYSAVISDNNYWTKLDAEDYLNDIEDCIKKLEK